MNWDWQSDDESAGMSTVNLSMLVPSLNSIHNAFEKPLPDVALDVEAIDRAVGDRDVPLVAIPGAAGLRRRSTTRPTCATDRPPARPGHR